MALIRKASEEKQKERVFQQWVAQFPYMDKKTFISFEDYWNKLTGSNIDRRSVAEIEADLAEAERELERGGGT